MFHSRLTSKIFTPALSGGVVACVLHMSSEHTTRCSAPRIVMNPTTSAAMRHFMMPFRRCLSSSAFRRCLSSSATTPANSGGGFMAWYEGHLQARPVQTKMVTGSILWGIGDAVAQIAPRYAAGSNGDDKEPSTSLNAKAAGSELIQKEFVYDWMRTGRAVLFGFALHAPTSHLHFNFLEWMTVRAGITGLKIPLFKAFMEQFVYWSWISNSMYHGAMGAMQGMTPQQIYDRIADVLWETQKAQWAFWIPVQLLNFQFIPVRHQLNVVLLTSIVWTALLSYWYPPQKLEGENVDQSTLK